MAAAFDYDVIVIGSGFGGSVAAMRAAEKGYKVAVLESGKRWADKEMPKTSWDLPKFIWQPELQMFGIQRIRYLDDVIVLSGSAVGGGSFVYANTLYVPHQKFFDAPTWSYITDWADELAPYYDQANRMLGVQISPYGDSDGDRLVRGVAKDMDRPYVRAPLGVYFGTPGVEVDDPYFGGMGPSRTGCIGAADCMIGCRYNAKNRMDKSYLYLAEKRGADVKELNEVHQIIPLADGGYEVHARHPGVLGHVERQHRYTAEQVIVAAHAYSTAQLLFQMKHAGHLGKLSDELGKRARTNSEALIGVQRSEQDYKADPERFHFVPGTSSVTAAIQADEESTMGPVYYGPGSNAMALAFTAEGVAGNEHEFRAWLMELIEHPIHTASVDDARNWSQRGFPMLCMRDHDDWLDLFMTDGILRSKPGRAGAPPPFLEIANDVASRIAEKMGGRPTQTLFAVGNRAMSSHFVGGMTMGDDPEKGVVDPYQRAFGHAGLHIMDGSVIAANPGVNPSHTIVALTERAMSFWPNKGDADPRPPLGSGYDRIKPELPHQPIVPKGAPAEYRLDPTTIDAVTIIG